MLGIFGTQGGRLQRRRRRGWRRLVRPEPVRSWSKAAARSQPLFAWHDRATQAQEPAWRLRWYRVAEQKPRVSRLDSLAFVVPKVGMARAVLRMVPVVAAATSRHLSAMDL